MNTDRPLHIRLAVPADYPALAQIMAENFRGKFVIALGRDPARRQRYLEALLPTGVLCSGHVYVAYRDGALVATFTIKMADTIPAADDYRSAREALAKVSHPLRAWWAITVLRLLGGIRLQPGEAYLDNLVVARAYQRQGVATSLADFFYEQSRSLGNHTIYGDVMSSNARVIGLFRQQGWEIVRRNYWLAPLTWPLLGTPGIFRIRKRLTDE